MPVKGLTGNLKVKLDVTSARLQNIGYLLVLLSLEHRLGWKSVSWRHCLPMDVGRLPTGKKGAPSGHSGPWENHLHGGDACPSSNATPLEPLWGQTSLKREKGACQHAPFGFGE